MKSKRKKNQAGIAEYLRIFITFVPVWAVIDQTLNADSH